MRIWRLIDEGSSKNYLRNKPLIIGSAVKNSEDGEESMINKVFQSLFEQLKEINLTIEEFFNYNFQEILDNEEMEIKSFVHDNIIWKIWTDLKWRKEPYFLFKRMLKLFLKQNFSVREEKALKKILKEVEEINDQSILKILANFPGKTEQSLRKMIKTMLNESLSES